MKYILQIGVPLCIIALLLLAYLQFSKPKPLDAATFDALYDNPQAAATNGMQIFHLGHSLVGRDIPAMLSQLAGSGHDYNSQLGWGTPLKAHWEPDEPINGFETENNHSKYRDATEAVQSGDYDAIILTEMVEIRDAIAYFDTPTYLHRWTDAAKTARPDVKLYLYETWHQLDDPAGWLNRIDNDLTLYWEDAILRPALAQKPDPYPIYVIPAGQVMAAFVRTIEDQGGIGNVQSRADLFTDQIHPSDLGSYLVALTHYAVLYQKSPIGLPHELTLANGDIATAPDPKVAQLMQETVWNVVRFYKRTGVR